MIVTFISQCDKKAINRTRRVLDAFANRIGDNTWQTVITEDGLLAVKQLLRKTVTKNTAVACHRQRSRLRSELVWIVGNRNKFNKEGVVPVNFTSKEVFMDVVNIKPQKDVLYANTHYQPLIEHLFAIGYVAQQLCLAVLDKKEAKDKEKFALSAFIAGCLHDIGKIDPQFQAWVTKDKSKTFVAEDGQHIDDTKFSFDKHPRHNEISYVIFKAFEQHAAKNCPVNPTHKRYIEHVIYWHHAKPFRKKDKGSKNFDTLNDIYEVFEASINNSKIQTFFENTFDVLEKVDALAASYSINAESVIKKLNWSKPTANFVEEFNTQSLLPPFKKYSSNKEDFKSFAQDANDNANCNVIRSCVITADRLISKLSAHALLHHIKHNTLIDLVNEVLAIESTLSSHISDCLTKFPDSERTQKQHQIALQLSGNNQISVLAGAAGCGKTKIALEWAKLKNAQQIIWICPRVQVCQGIFDELTKHYLPNTKIEIATGEFKFTNTWDSKTPEDEYFSGDIIITTIDQILSAIISHSKIDMLLKFMKAHVVFDEYHEYINEPAFVLLFAELIACKKLKENQADTLLVSATPHNFYLKELLKIDSDNIAVMPSFNHSLYKIEFCKFEDGKRDESNPLYKQQTAKTFVISNTAKTAQLSFIQNHQQENGSILLHSKFKKSDKKYLFEEVYESFKQDGDNKYTILRSGPIVQASLNISCDYMVSEMTTAENILQRLGRLDRFGKNTHGVNLLTIAITENVITGKQVDSSARFLNSLNSLQSTKAWYELLINTLDDKPFQLSQLYKLYEEFYQSNQGQTAVSSDLLKTLKTSVTILTAKVNEPLVIPSKKPQTEGRAKISKTSLRGDNRFVQMAVCDVNNPTHPVVLNQYAYNFAVRDTEQFDNLTESLDTIRNYGLVDYMAQKHARIDKTSIIEGIPANKMTIRKMLLENFARDPEYPIYLSYTPNDLLHQLGEKTAHTEAIYYAVCEKQPIGAIAMKQLLNNDEE